MTNGAFDDPSKLLLERIVFLVELAQDCLGSGLTGEDAELVRDVRKHLGIFASKMRIDQGKITGPFPSNLATTIWDFLGEMDTKNSSREEFRKIQTKRARDARGKRKKATLEAIKKIRGEGPSEHPYKEGALICESLNLFLEAGIAKATDDYIGQLLAKEFPWTDSPSTKFSVD
jgi:hypothetical protein